MDKDFLTTQIPTEKVLQNLDTILDVLKLPNYKTFIAICKDNIDQTINTGLVEEYEAELFEKGYIQKLDIERNIRLKYCITIKGRVFEGYVNQKNRLELEKNDNSRIIKEQQATQDKMLLVTIILAIGIVISSFYYFIEMAKYFKWL